MEEICTIEVSTAILRELNDVFKCGIHYEIKTVDVKGFDYSIYPEWIEQKKLSSKMYMKLKEIEYKIRHR